MKVGHVNWEKYGFEFLSIFIALISAFALNNWNDKRHSRNAENKVLTEISIGLEKDLADIKVNETGHKNGIRSANFFRDMIAGKPVRKDSIIIHYIALTRDFVSLQNTSGYEVLKSKGLELIENDSLRTMIVSLYEYDFNTLRKLEEEYSEMQFHENYFKEINAILSRHFIFDANKTLTGFNLPLKMSETEEKLFLTYLIKMQMNRAFILQFYSDIEKSIEKVQAQIKKEVN